ncbi:DUF2252 domain-containing protein [Marinospirillum perlucidum]|uniref:DUF2252 domain-containing protein n=1 Tax=Marinospirillum perlucidum TaxID=1982602 RepID=UPI000DF3CA85|nr:DUF2252 family protein [Marinospirillum perlucidum]
MPTRTAQNRAEQVIEHLQTTNKDLKKADRQRKFSKMAISAFSFYRGSNDLYWKDLYRDWHFSLYGGISETQTWLQGDAHLHNFGAYGSHDSKVRFGLDDFDDGLVGDYQYDLWRLAISLVLAMREEGIDSGKKLHKAVKHLGKSYLHHLQGDLQATADWVALSETSEGRLQKFLEKTAKGKSRKKMLAKWTETNKQGQRRFQSDNPKLARLSKADYDALNKALDAYQATLADEIPGHSQQHFKVKDIARRLDAGTGSLGTDRFYALVEGQAKGDHDDVILDIKEQQAPAACLAMSADEVKEYQSSFTHEAERHAQAFQAMARHPDPYVGWLQLGKRFFSVRERSPFKADFPTHKLKKTKHWQEMAWVWGRILAASHLRGARALHQGDPTPFAATIVKLVKQHPTDFLNLLTQTAEAYATCVAQDYGTFCEWLKTSENQAKKGRK